MEASLFQWKEMWVECTMIEWSHSQVRSATKWRSAARFFSLPLSLQHCKHPRRCVDMVFKVERESGLDGYRRAISPTMVGTEIVRALPLERNAEQSFSSSRLCAMSFLLTSMSLCG